MTRAQATDAWEEAYAAARDALPGAAWLARGRERALTRFRELGFPSRRLEAWLYTDVGAVARTSFAPAPAPGPEELAAARALLDSIPDPEGTAGRLVFVNGFPRPSLSARDRLPPGVVLESLADVLARDGADLEDRLTALVSGEEHAFAALNTALWRDGALVRVGPEADAAAPLHLVFLTVGPAAATAVHPRLLVLVEPGSRAAIVETWAGDAAGPRLCNTVVEVWLEANARLDLLEVQAQPREVLHFRNFYVHQARDTRLSATCLALGAKLARNDVTVRLDAPGAECQLDGLSLVTGHQHVDHQTNVDHAQPHGTSRQLYKGILDDRGTVVFSGRVLVRPHAQKTDARQANHNLLLSEDATADSKPQLEIFADDVKCAHGATVGRLDEEAIFYLRSRGLDVEAARALLLDAFAAEVPERMENAALRDHAEATLARRSERGR